MNKKHIFGVMLVCLLVFMPGLAFSQTGPNDPIRSIIIRNSTGIDIYYFFIKQAGNSNKWSDDLLDFAEVYIIDAGDVENVYLENYLNSADRYDLLIIDDEDNVYIKRNIQLSKYLVIEFTRRDMDKSIDPYPFYNDYSYYFD
ncbi:MAG: hypothetical protein LBH43_13280 [Treponema sp.]|jgi:hypothetical protein|nr:hypothetical protein [Treponema sp.]